MIILIKVMHKSGKSASVRILGQRKHGIEFKSCEEFAPLLQLVAVAGDKETNDVV